MRPLMTRLPDDLPLVLGEPVRQQTRLFAEDFFRWYQRLCDFERGDHAGPTPHAEPDALLRPVDREFREVEPYHPAALQENAVRIAPSALTELMEQALVLLMRS
jgi:hypothetical protein